MLLRNKESRRSVGKTTASQVRSVQRAIDILVYLGEHGSAGLQQLHTGTGISKAALQRLLATLLQKHFVRVGITDRMYRTNVSVPTAINAEAIRQVGNLVEIARAHMIALTEMTRWPCELHLYQRGRMRILELTHGMTPFVSRAGFGAGAELNIFAAASGLAVLASRGDDFALQLANELKNEELWSLSRFRITPKRLLDDLQEIRQKGFATRRVPQGRFYDRNAIAVAILSGNEPIGALTLSWNRKLSTADAFAEKHLDALQSAAGLISRQLGDV